VVASVVATAASIAVLAVQPVGAQTDAGNAAGVEWAGGTLGSAAGVGIGLLLADPGSCGEDDVGCVLERLGIVGLTTAATTPLGVWAGGAAASTEPHVLGAVLGGVVGVGASLGAMRLFSELGLEPSGIAAVAVYAVTQGLVAAAGSRLGASLRGD
jgi:hypothetical protein